MLPSAPNGQVVREDAGPVGALEIPEELLTPRDAAAVLRVSLRKLYALMSTGLLPWFSIAGTRGRRIARRDLESLLHRRGGWAAGRENDG